MELWIGISIGVIILLFKYLFRGNHNGYSENTNLYLKVNNQKNEGNVIQNSGLVSETVLIQKPLNVKKYSIKSEDVEEFIKEFVLNSDWLRGKDVENILYATEPLNSSIDDIRKCAQYFIRDFNRSIFIRIFKSMLAVKYRTKTNELCLLVEGRTIIKSSSETNFINEIYTFLRNEVVLYERLPAIDKFRKLAAHFGVKVYYTSKYYSYIINNSELIVSKKVNPVNLVEKLEEMDYYWVKSFFNYMLLYALQFDGFFMKDWEDSSIRLNICNLLNELRLTSSRLLLRKVKNIAGVKCVKIEYSNKEYYVIEFTEERYGYLFKIAQKTLIYNYTNSHPMLDFRSKIQMDVIRKFREIYVH